MILTPADFDVACSCGKKHRVQLEKAVIAPGALHGLNDVMAGAGYGGPVAAVYDANTYQAAAGRRPKADTEVVLDPEGLHADERAVQALDERLGAPAVLVAVGAGTIHDITRYCAAKRGIPFVSAPTAASVDGFVSSVAAMTWGGFKVTLPAVPPALLVADTEVIAAAPWRLTASGVGDVLGKYTSLCDWRVGRLLTGEYYCDGIAGLIQAAVDKVLAGYGRLRGGDLDAYASLVKALVLSGVAIQLAGNSRPASACEHHVSHIIEMEPDWIGKNQALHGEKVGVGTLLCAAEYHRWAALDAGAFAALRAEERLRGYSTPGAETLQAAFGRMAGAAMKENENDCLLAVPPAAPQEKWERVRAELMAVPEAAAIEAVLAGLGASRTLADIGVDPALEGRILYWSPYVRNRLTFMRLRHLLVPCPD